jgi:hypothetical protein
MDWIFQFEKAGKINYCADGRDGRMKISVFVCNLHNSKKVPHDLKFVTAPRLAVWAERVAFLRLFWAVLATITNIYTSKIR